MLKFLNTDLLSNLEVNNDYFPFFSSKQALKDSVDPAELVTSFPSINDGGSFPLQSVNLGTDLGLLIEELEGPVFKKLLEQKFKVDLKNKHVVTTLRGYSRKKDGQIHTDSTSKIITVLLYLNTDWEDVSGCLRLLKNSNDLEDFIEEVPCSFGSMVAFKVTDNCWHGFAPYEGKRLSIQLNYIHPESFKIHSIRHKLSAFLKKFKV
jgi:SM-20-related protein|tara:strand:- start:970 stop:1590 length:621 start_codon:yes stop_codon:yes gene_type:complete